MHVILAKRKCPLFQIDTTEHYHAKSCLATWGTRRRCNYGATFNNYLQPSRTQNAPTYSEIEQPVAELLQFKYVPFERRPPSGIWQEVNFNIAGKHIGRFTTRRRSSVRKRRVGQLTITMHNEKRPNVELISWDLIIITNKDVTTWYVHIYVHFIICTVYCRQSTV